MIRQVVLGITEKEQKQKIRSLIRNGTISLAGNRDLKIYGRLNCGSGKQMNAENRVFFCNEKEALQKGYRPCGTCMHKRYLQWKEKQA
ncbi:Ada metal-binding domain-containing protein [Fodinibius halophilus]|uniref:Metal-binding protein n=1 Tax=Fodinibius halophilus TaxID=1736908 RepID=A0A6M1T7I7_9BACT|nr:Ada metal-binding domain-containing protein [Fodinibius halophilus]NGP87084.1 metal-binding protein [Fodinibius halophilus]